MSIWQTPLGMGIVNNPLVDSPYVDQEDIGVGAIPALNGILTEGGAFILTEGGDFITTE